MCGPVTIQEHSIGKKTCSLMASDSLTKECIPLNVVCTGTIILGQFSNDC